MNGKAIAMLVVLVVDERLCSRKTKEIAGRLPTSTVETTQDVVVIPAKMNDRSYHPAKIETTIPNDKLLDHL